METFILASRTLSLNCDFIGYIQIYWESRQSLLCEPVKNTKENFLFPISNSSWHLFQFPKKNDQTKLQKENITALSGVPYRETTPGNLFLGLLNL